MRNISYYGESNNKDSGKILGDIFIKLFSEEKIFDFLYKADLLKDPDKLVSDMSSNFYAKKNKKLILCDDKEIYWVVPYVEDNKEAEQNIMVFSAESGIRVTDVRLLRKIKSQSCFFQEYNWMPNLQQQKGRDYIPMTSISVMEKIIKYVGDKETTKEEISNDLEMSLTLITNCIRDLRNMGIIEYSDKKIVNLCEIDNVYIAFTEFFDSNIVYKSMISLYGNNKGFTKIDFERLFDKVYIDYGYADSTMKQYCYRLFNWLVDLKKVVLKDNSLYYINDNSQDDGRIIKREGLGRKTKDRLFLGEASPETVMEAYTMVVDGHDSYKYLYNNGMRNAIDILIYTHTIDRKGNKLAINDNYNTFIEKLKRNEVIVCSEEIINNNRNIKGCELGELISIKFNKEWSAASKLRYGSAVLRWTKYLYD